MASQPEIVRHGFGSEPELRFWRVFSSVLGGRSSVDWYSRSNRHEPGAAFIAGNTLLAAASPCVRPGKTLRGVSGGASLPYHFADLSRPARSECLMHLSPQERDKLLIHVAGELA